MLAEPWSTAFSFRPPGKSLIPTMRFVAAVVRFGSRVRAPLSVGMQRAAGK